ncbi:MAG: transporter substrate-binding domain-containing protein [Gammaproteobacteria bacterium]|nr:transporter substrate-binding domain-containing protein [Gammaproteobacteria bacterium]
MMMQLSRLPYLLLILILAACGDKEPPAEAPVPEAEVATAGEEAPFTNIAPAAAEDDLPESYDVIREWIGDLDGMEKRRVIRVLTVYSVGRYYVDGAVEKGLVRESAQIFEEFINKRFKRKHARIHVVVIPVARNQLIPALLEGRGDIIDASLSITPEREDVLGFSIPASKPLSEVLVTGPAAPKLDSIDDLSGQTLFVRRSSSYRESVEELNKRFHMEGKAPVIIKPVSELLEDDDLIEMVNAGLLPWAVVDDYKIQWWDDVFTNLEVRDDIVFRSGGRMAWAFRKGSPKLEKAVNDFLKKNREGTLVGNVLKNRYIRDFDWASNALERDNYTRFEKLESIFQKYGKQYGIEYLMVAAQGYQESRLDQSARSRAGAIGIMQIKASTAGDKNVNIKNIHEVDANIHAGVKYLDFLRTRYFDEPGIDPLNQTLLALAAYNVGPSRMINLRNKATKMGYDRNVWFDNVELAAAKHVGREPVQYVANIYKYYLAYLLSAEQVLQRKTARERAGI